MFYSALVLEIIFSFRHKVHDIADRWLDARGLYGSRGDWQGDLLLLAIVLVATAGLMLIAKNRRHSAGLPAPTLYATIALLGCFVVETISLHGVDAIMYFPIGPLLLIGLGWLTASVVVIASALQAINRRDDRH